MVMSQNATLSQELDVLRESLTRLQTSANQTLADLSEKEAELRIQKRERFECESKLYSAAAEHDRMKSDAQASAARMLQVKLLSSSSTTIPPPPPPPLQPPSTIIVIAQRVAQLEGDLISTKEALRDKDAANRFLLHHVAPSLRAAL